MKRRNFLKALPAAALALAGCGQAETAPANTASLVFDHSYPLDYAAQFSADCYEGGYVLVNIPDSGRFLVIPEDAAEVDDLPADVVPLRQPLGNIYLVSTSVKMCIRDSMSILVHDSNKAACRAAAAALQQGCRAALVRPAGTGKGRIVWEMLAEQPDTRVLWVASCAARLELRRGLAKELGKTLDGGVRLLSLIHICSGCPHPG